VLDLLGVGGRCRPYSVMAPQWNVQFDSPEVQRQAVRGLQAAYYKTPGQELFACTEVGNTICINIRQKLPRPIDWDADCVFPETGRTVKMRDLCAEKDATPKQGYHEQAGVVMMAGPGVRAGAEVGSGDSDFVGALRETMNLRLHALDDRSDVAVVRVGADLNYYEVSGETEAQGDTGILHAHARWIGGIDAAGDLDAGICGRNGVGGVGDRKEQENGGEKSHEWPVVTRACFKNPS